MYELSLWDIILLSALSFILGMIVVLTVVKKEFEEINEATKKLVDVFDEAIKKYNLK